MARKILVADRDPAYAQALARRIQKHCPACEVTIAVDEAAFRDQLAKTAGELSLVVSAAHFPVDNLPSGVSQLILLETRIEPEDLTNPTRPVRLGSVQPILDRLDMARHGHPAEEPATRGLAARNRHAGDLPAAVPGSPASSIPENAGPVGTDSGTQNEPGCEPDASALNENASPKSVQPRVVLLLTQTTSGRQSFFTDQRCLELGQNGETVFYLPLLPNFLCRNAPSAGPGSGPSLTDLLLRVCGGGLAPQDLGACVAIDSQGRMQVRPTDRADDLFDCRPHDLFQFVSLLREWVLSQSRPVLVIEAACVPFRSIQAILPLCDQIEIIMPEDAGFAGQALRREISEILAESSAGTRVIQIPESSLKRQHAIDAARASMPAASGPVRTAMSGAAQQAGTARKPPRGTRHVPA